MNFAWKMWSTVLVGAMLIACGGEFSASCCAGPQFGQAEQSILPDQFRKVKTNLGSFRIPARRACLGKLKVGINNGPRSPQFVAAGTQNISATVVEFASTGCEGMTTKKLRVVNTSSSSNVSASGASDDMVERISLIYYGRNGLTTSAQAFLVNGVADFSDLDIYAPAGRAQYVSIIWNASNLSYASSRTEIKTVRLGLDFGIAGNTNFQAVGESSGITLTTGEQLTPGIGFANNTEPLAADLIEGFARVAKTKLVVVLASSSPSGRSVPGLGEMLRYSVCADAAGTAEISRNTFKVISTDNHFRGWNQATSSVGSFTSPSLDASKFRVYDAYDLSYPIEGQWTLWDEAGNSFVTPTKVGYARFNWLQPRVIAAGTCKTFVVKTDTTGAGGMATDNDAVRLDVAGDDSPAYSAGGDGSTAGQHRGSSFSWNETGANAVSNITGYILRNLPVIGGTLIY